MDFASYLFGLVQHDSRFDSTVIWWSVCHIDKCRAAGNPRCCGLSFAFMTAIHDSRRSSSDDLDHGNSAVGESDFDTACRHNP